MACKKCASIRQQEFPGELSVIFPGFQRLKRSPVYINQTIFVCLDCGFAELVIPGVRIRPAQGRVVGIRFAYRLVTRSAVFRFSPVVSEPIAKPLSGLYCPVN